MSGRQHKGKSHEECNDGTRAFPTKQSHRTGSILTRKTNLSFLPHDSARVPSAARPNSPAEGKLRREAAPRLCTVGRTGSNPYDPTNPSRVARQTSSPGQTKGR